MALKFHPKVGTILVCNFEPGFTAPEMVKRRPVVVVSPPISIRPGLCTVVAISTGKPSPKTAYHFELTTLVLPPPFEKGPNWVKADMVNAVSFERLELFKSDKDANGKRTYYSFILSDDDLKEVRKAVLCGMGLGSLTKHL